MSKFFIQLFTISILFSSSLSLASSCANLFAHDILKLGESVKVSLVNFSLKGINDNQWEAGAPRSLIYLGRLTKNEDVPELFIFSDKDLNTYYLGSEGISINGRMAKTIDTPDFHFLPPIIRQTTGSCNMCANITSINALALRSGLEPLRLSGQKLEANPEINQFSYDANVKKLLDTIYKAAWPEGFREGLDPQLSVLEMIRAVQAFQAAQTRANNQSISEVVSESAPLPISANIKITSNAHEFIDHIRKGGSAVVAGAVNPDATQKITNEGTGYKIITPKSELSPYPYQGILGRARRILSGLKKTKKTMAVINQILDGVKPNEEMVKLYMDAQVSEVGHAVAAIGYIRTGPLKDHIVISNSWGVLEIHPLSSFKNNLNYTLYFSIEKRD